MDSEEYEIIWAPEEEQRSFTRKGMRAALLYVIEDYFSNHSKTVNYKVDLISETHKVMTYADVLQQSSVVKL